VIDVRDAIDAELCEQVEREMTRHWDMAACPCLLCQLGRAIGCRPRRVYLRGSDPASTVPPAGVAPHFEHVADTYEIAAAGERFRADLERIDLQPLARRVVETFAVADADMGEAHDAAMTALGAALGYDLEVR